MGGRSKHARIRWHKESMIALQLVLWPGTGQISMAAESAHGADEATR